jgi:hypothetical protein
MNSMLISSVGFMALIASAQTEKIVSPWQKEIDAAEQEMRTLAEAARGTIRLTLCVKDTTGSVVSNAATWVSICYYGRKTVPVTGKTDINGLFSVEKESTDNRVLFIVEKDGYYRTEREFWLKEVSQLNGGGEKRWIPWNPTVDVVLKEKRKPVQMAVLLDKPLVFLQNQKIGFDCEKGDLLPPFGKGEHEDFTFLYTSRANPQGRTTADMSFYTNKLVVATDKDGGFIEHKRDKFSKFWSIYDAPETGYQNTLVYETERGGGKMIKNKQFDVQTDYLIFKTRIKRDKDGNIISANYGKIYSFTFGEGAEPWGTKGGVSLWCYYNPAPNDRNLEADPSKNLSYYIPRWGDNKGFEP